MTKKEENAENICHWNECLTQYATAEDLFNHVCSTHIGAGNSVAVQVSWRARPPYLTGAALSLKQVARAPVPSASNASGPGAKRERRSVTI